jgi:hypothetical protein
MKPEARRTTRDPRALKHEQWIVKVRTLDDGRTFQVPADQAKWEKLRENDRIKVRYRTDKYTGTVWAAEIEKELNSCRTAVHRLVITPFELEFTTDAGRPLARARRDCAHSVSSSRRSCASPRPAG